MEYLWIMSRRFLVVLMFIAMTDQGRAQQDTIIKIHKDTIFCYVTRITNDFIYYVKESKSADTLMVARHIKSGTESVENIVYCSAYKRFHIKSSSTIHHDSGQNRGPCSSVQCSGRTQEGHRCKRMTTNCSGRCYQH